MDSQTDQLFQVQNDVLIGREGELYLASGGHRVLEYVLGRRPIDPSIVEIFRRNIAGRATLMAAKGIVYRHIIFPDKQSVVMQRFVTAEPIRLGASYLDGSHIAEDVIYPVHILQSSSDRVYQRTDTHLTDRGSIEVASEIAEVLMGQDVSGKRADLLQDLTIKRFRQGDLGSKLSPPVEAEETFARIHWPLVMLENDTAGGNNGGISIFFSPNSMTPQRVLWFGDSFGRASARFLSAFFREILFLRTPFLHPEMVDQMQPDFVISSNVERYLASCVADELRPSFHMYPFVGRGTAIASAQFARAFTGITAYPRPPYREFLQMVTNMAYEKPA